MVRWMFVLCMLPFTLKAQVYRWSEVEGWMDRMENDSLMQLEFRAALHFHHLLNDYRTKQRLDTLALDPLVWLAAYNHSVYMRALGRLGHTQEKKDAFFTGTMPGDRYAWAAGGMAPDLWSGENVLMNYSATAGDNLDKIAQKIAESSFSQWKNSKPHYENMTGKNHAKHGVAFAIQGNKVWGTDLFSSGRKRFEWPKK